MLLLASSASGSIWTVKKVGGDFDTINAALSAAASGDAIQVEAAVFPENIYILKAITLEGGYDKNTWGKTGTTSISPNSIEFLGARNAIVDSFTADSLSVRDCNALEITSCMLSSAGFIVMYSQNVRIHHNTVSNTTGSGLIAQGCNYLYFYNNTISGNQYGASITASNTIEVYNNIFSENPINGLYINTCENLYFHDNQVTDNGKSSPMAGYGIEIRRTSGILARNIITGNNWCGLEIWDTPVPSLGNLDSGNSRDIGENKIYNNGRNMFWGNNLMYGAPVNMKAQNNDWGTTDILEIDRGIYDDEEDPAYNGKVEFLPLYQIRQVAPANIKAGPNPFNPEIQTFYITFDLLSARTVACYVFDIAGNLHWRRNYSGSVGANSIAWDGKSDFGNKAANGLYIYKLVVDGKVLGGGKIIVLR